MEKESKKEYQREWYKNNKEKARGYTKKYLENNREKVNEMRRKYYHEHKDTIYAQQKEYIARNRAKITKMVNERRRIVAKELKEKGRMYCFLPIRERQTKMITKLSYHLNISEELSRKMLEENDWNIKMLLKECDNK